MKEEIQIAINSRDWGKSKITVVGLLRNGRAVKPYSISAESLPTEQLAQWEQMITMLQNMGSNEWLPSFITMTRTDIECPVTTTALDDKEQQTKIIPAIVFGIKAEYVDNTTERKSYTLADEAAATCTEEPESGNPIFALFEYLTKTE